MSEMTFKQAIRLVKRRHRDAETLRYQGRGFVCAIAGYRPLTDIYLGDFSDSEERAWLSAAERLTIPNS